MAELLRALVEIESPTGEAAGVAALGERLAGELRALGLHVELLPVTGCGPIVLARAAADSARGRPVMLLGHLDTVWPIGTLAVRPWRVEGDRCYGPGAYDMKGGLVVIVFALRALRERGELPPLTVFLTPREEVGGEPYRRLMEEEMRRSSACLCFEPAWPGGAVKTARKGSGTFLLRAHGRAAHAGADLSKGASAILELARQCLDIAALTDPDRGISANVGVIRGGLRPNVVPEEAEAEIDVRYRTRAEGELLAERLRALRPHDRRVTLTLAGSLGYPPLERTAQVAALFERAREVATELGLPLEEVATGGASEASFAAALGLPTLDGLGPDGDGAHAADENVRLASLPERAALVAGLLESLSRRAL